MRNSMPLQWIEQAEASVVLTAARFERTPGPSWQVAMAARLASLRAWLMPGDAPLEWLPLQARLVPIRCSEGRRVRRPGEYASRDRSW